jgi:hypothetical protein
VLTRLPADYGALPPAGAGGLQVAGFIRQKENADEVFFITIDQ